MAAQHKHPLKRLSQRQKHGATLPLVHETETRVRDTFAQAKRDVGGTLAAFTAAYRDEYDRRAAIAQAQADAEDDRDAEGFRVPPEPVRVPIHWLISSGWLPRVKHVLASAADTAAQQSRVHVRHAYDDAAALGRVHAHELLTHAMQPAIRAGMDWRPK